MYSNYTNSYLSSAPPSDGVVDSRLASQSARVFRYAMYYIASSIYFLYLRLNLSD